MDRLNFIGGEFVAAASGKTFENRSPVDARLLGLVSEAGEAEVDAAVKAARAALAGPWGALDMAARTALLYAVANEINRRFDAFLEAEVVEIEPLHFMKVTGTTPGGGRASYTVRNEAAGTGTDSRLYATSDGGGLARMCFFIFPITCISHGLQSKRSVRRSPPLISVIGSARTCPCTPVTPLACFGHRLNEKRRQCLVTISDTSPLSSCTSKAASISLTPCRT